MIAPLSPSRGLERVKAGIALALAIGFFGAVLVGGDTGRRSGASSARAAMTENNSTAPSDDPFPQPADAQRIDFANQTTESAIAKSRGCVLCHRGEHEPHGKPETVRLGCVDCHGGNPAAADKRLAHVFPRYPDAWGGSSANPVRSYTLLNHESPGFIRFVNPGDLRVAHLSCGTRRLLPREPGAPEFSPEEHRCRTVPCSGARPCTTMERSPTSGPASGESYSMHGAPLRLQTVPPPTEFEIARKGVVPFLDPLPRYEISQPGNVLRIFEIGRRDPQEIGLPNPFEDNGRPKAGLSARGLGTKNRTDPTFLGLQKTRLLDPTLNFLGTNDHPGDYRSSGCTACHMIYANDRSRVNSGPYAFAGNLGMTLNPDPTIPKNERSHPIASIHSRPRFRQANCIVCHIHPGTNVLNSYTGFMWWDEETDGELLYPREPKHPTAEEFAEAQFSNPDEAAARGLWSDPRFLERVADLNGQTKHTQFADFHGHGWVFRAVYKKDRKGNLLDHKGDVIPVVTNDLLQKAMSLPALDKEVYRTSRSDDDRKAYERFSLDHQRRRSGASNGRASSEGDALRGLPLRARCARQYQALW